MERRRPGAVRDAILVALKEAKGPQTVAEIRTTVESSRLPCRAFFDSLVPRH